jgi:hypothetical protein
VTDSYTRSAVLLQVATLEQCTDSQQLPLRLIEQIMLQAASFPWQVLLAY